MTIETMYKIGLAVCIFFFTLWYVNTQANAPSSKAASWVTFDAVLFGLFGSDFVQELAFHFLIFFTVGRTFQILFVRADRKYFQDKMYRSFIISLPRQENRDD